MKTATATESIDVQALRVGMFVHLDVGWMSHPFPLSSFRITSPAQVATIRSLGLKVVRWSPGDSALDVERDDSEGDAAGSHAAPTARSPGAAAANDPRGATDSPGDGPDTIPHALAGRVDPAEPAQAWAGADRARRLQRQRQAQRRCEQQYLEASRACRHAVALVPARPQEARAEAEALARAITAKMVGEQDLCIRMLSEGAGDKASMHAMNVGIVSLLMGRCFGFADDEMQDLGVGALLHDIGKLDMPARLRHREDNFSASETRFYEEHVQLGVAQARRMGLSTGATEVIAQHHEHADGSGFPARLNSDRMTMAARIVAIVNRYDNLCNPHLLARALTPHESLSLLFAQGRSRYDTSILSAFIKMMGVYPPGSTVQLTDDRYALVMAVNSARPLKPHVLVHDPATPRDDALVLDLEGAGGLGIRRSVRPQQLPPPAAEYLALNPRVAYFFEPARPVEE